MLFEWDEDKDGINRQKHEMPLKAGIPAFDDLNAIEFKDGRYNYGSSQKCVNAMGPYPGARSKKVCCF